MQDNQTSPGLMPAKTVGRSPAQLERHARKERERKARRRAEGRPIVRKSFERGCALCPHKGPGLAHHHLKSREKKGNVARLISRSNEALQSEIDKCVVLCDRCHREHHGVEFLVQVGGES